MSNQLISVFNGSISNEASLLCNARDLHAFLEVGKRFASWISERIAEYEFIENQDYILISQIGETKGRGGDRRSKDYHLTLDTAKELAMVERNEKGRQIRRYFIECEKRLQQRTQEPLAEQTKTHFITLTDEELCSLCWLWSAAEYMRVGIETVYPALRTLGSDKAGNFYSMAFEYKLTLNRAKSILERETKAIQPHPHNISSSNWRNVLPRLRQAH